ncbi:annexin A4-like [Paramormyrops kingsleyae]|uniref:Annexin n=1 Tax=Paramormyrops kingsleyae TaxID=1676925 RepID=A0A3B3S0Y9_9TELE|nr:annexin A4-like [Paramormyrops kingsleyae]XP_023657839.1 annexin A4-like [Paramormyrops kingsleyae]
MAAMGTHGTIVVSESFNPEADAKKLRAAMKGIGTNEGAIIEVLAHRTNAQRQLIKEAFKRSFGKNLVDELKSELSGNFEKVVLGLLMPSPVYDAYELKNAIKGAGTEEACLIEILASRSGEEIEAIKATYTKEYGRSLEEDICGDTSGMFQRVLVSLLTAGRDRGSFVNEAQALQDAKDIFEAGEAQWGTDEATFLTVLCVRNRNHLLRVFQEYKRISGRDIEESIKREMSGNLENIFLAIVSCIRKKPAFFAEQLYKSMKGAGTADSTLIRIMVSRAEVDMMYIKPEFAMLCGKSLHSYIKDDTSGDYRTILLELCGGGGK